MAKIFVALVCVLSHVATASSDTAKQDISQRLVDLENEMRQFHEKNQKIRLQNEKMANENTRLNGECLKLRKGLEESRRFLQAADLAGALDHLWLIICGALVMLMQAGFAMVESGCCRIKNVQNILLKNLMDVCMGTLCWWAWGWMISYGFDSSKPDQVFAGNLQYFGHEFLEADADGNQTPTNLPRDWFFQWAFCATAATIVSGGVAERMALPAYVLYSIVMTGVIYPFVVYWTWSTKGWLTIGSGKDADSPDGYSDFAGSGIVHLVGGVGALTGAILLGPRKDRFIKPELFKPCAPELCVLGTFILWFGWYGFNCGSQLSMAGDGDAYAACLVAMNSTLAAATGGTTVFLIRLAVARGKEFDMCGMCNGILAGLVAICAGVANVEPSMAIVTGLVGGIFEELGHFLLLALKVDDPLDAFPVHGCGGIAGILTRPLFDWSGAKDTMFGWHCIGLGSIGAWVAVWSLFLMGIMKVIGKSKPGLFRVSAEEEETGGDTKLSHSPLKPYEKDTIWNDPAPAPASHEM
mmetsp:Transcript_1544/g.3093  ORF Transcript_1544/g.3093 Transcript_1544/m.3093 type:complete len:525 (+) Transcript_1544:45-1619(+)